MVNGQLKAETKQKTDSFTHSFTIHGKRLTIQSINEGFDIMYDGTLFQVLWEQEKRKNSFSWDNKNKRHDPFAVRNFGENVDSVVAPTTREAGTAQAINLEVMARTNNNEETKDKPAERSSEDAAKRKQAIKELEDEKK